jgi:hypothetical protein
MAASHEEPMGAVIATFACSGAQGREMSSGIGIRSRRYIEENALQDVPYPLVDRLVRLVRACAVVSARASSIARASSHPRSDAGLSWVLSCAGSGVSLTRGKGDACVQEQLCCGWQAWLAEM